MISISHPQARRLIRRSLDHRLAEEQWDALQAHLESCPDCLGYRARLEGDEKSLCRALRARLGSLPGPTARDLPQTLASGHLARARARDRLHTHLFSAGAGLLALAFIVLYITSRRAAPPAAPPPPTPTVTATPTRAAPGQAFRGAALFEAPIDGQSEVFLLNAAGPRPELANLTAHPAADTAPVWSPDGEWIAFLSNRTGKNEVYTQHVSGSRLTQITGDPAVDWQGPLTWSWSVEGSVIAAVGVEARAGEHNRPPGRLYLIPLDGTPAYPLGRTQGAANPRFAPRGSLLAFELHGGVQAINISTGRRVDVTGFDTELRGMLAGPGGLFDWSPDGRSLVYIGVGPITTAASGRGPSGRGPSGGGSNAGAVVVDPETGEAEAGSAAHQEIRVTTQLDGDLAWPYDSSANRLVLTASAPGGLLDAAWTAYGSSVVYAISDRAFGCGRLYALRAYDSGGPAERLSGPCLGSPLDETSWTRDGRWLLLYGQDGAIWAAHNPARSAPYPLTLEFQRLEVETADSASGDSALNVRGPVRARPALPNAGRIDPPQPNPPPPAARSALALPDLSGVLLLRSGAYGSQIARLNVLDGGGLSAASVSLFTDEMPIACLTPSPDGRWMAFTRSLNDRQRVLYVMDQAGGGLRPLPILSPDTRLFSHPDLEPGAAQTLVYDCPAWSPDGRRIASVVHTDAFPYLAVIPAFPGEEDAPGDTAASAPAASAPAASASAGTAGSAPLTGLAGLYYLNPARAEEAALPPGQPRQPDEETTVGRASLPASSPASSPASLPASSPPTQSPSVRYLLLDPASTYGEPAWSPDGRAVLLSRSAPGAQRPHLLALNPTGPFDQISREVSPRSSRRTGLTAPVFSPDGRWLAYLETRAEPENEIITGLAITDADGLPLHHWRLLPSYSALEPATRYGGLTWTGSDSASLTPGGRLGFYFSGSPAARDKTIFYLYTPAAPELRVLAALPDHLVDAAFSPDGRWLIYVTETGLYLLDVEAALSASTTPAFLSAESILDVEWPAGEE